MLRHSDVASARDSTNVSGGRVSGDIRFYSQRLTQTFYHCGFEKRICVASLCPHRRRQTRRAALCLHVHGDFHSEFIVGIAPVATRERNCLLGCPGDAHPDEVSVADDAIRGIEFDPAGAGDLDLARCVGRTSAQANRPVAIGYVDVAGNEARGEAQRACRFHHE